MKLLLIELLLLVILSSCEPTYDSIEIRIRNESSYEFKNILVGTDKMYSYGNLSSQSSSEYQIHEHAFRLAYIELTIGDSIFTLQPKCFVGEDPLITGQYTYHIFINESNANDIRLNMKTTRD